MAKKKLKVLYFHEERIPQTLQEIVLSYLKKGDLEVKQVTYLAAPKKIIKKLEWAEAVFFAPGRFLDETILSHAKHIKLMQLWSSGYDKFNVAGAKKFGIPVANNGGANAGSVAEHAILLMMAVYKWLPNSHWRTTTGNWAGNSHGLDMHTLKGRTLGIIGFGNIGRQVAKKVSGFEMKILYYDVKRAEEKIEQELHATYMSFEELLKKSDIVTLHLHANEKTKNILDAKEIGWLKPNAVLINVSRAQLVNQTALYAALKEKKIHGAGIDVYLKEPTEANDPLLNLPNVVSTPHMAGSTLEAYELALQNSLENFKRVAQGKKPLWLIS